MRYFVHGLLLAALVLTGGHHMAVIQAVAWTGMIIRFSQESTFTESLARTFSGEEPCRLCQFVANQQDQDTPDAPVDPSTSPRSFQFLAPDQSVLPAPVEGTRAFPKGAFPAPESRSDAPLAPPPDLA